MTEATAADYAWFNDQFSLEEQQRAALFADPRTALYATLERLRCLPGDRWTAIRAAALAVLRSGRAAGPSDAVDR